MKRTPDVLFVVDVVKEAIAVSEANRLHIPVVALVDTNADPGNINFVIPSNDDAARTIRLFVAAVADAVIEGREIHRSRFAGEHGKSTDGAGKTILTETKISDGQQNGAAHA